MCGTDDDTYEHSLIALSLGSGKRPEWKRPENPIVWSCSGCDTQIVRDLDFATPCEYGYDYHLTGSNIPYYGSDVEWDDLIDAHRAGESIGRQIGEGHYCPHCAHGCDDCGESIFRSQYLENGEIAYGDTYDPGASFPDPRHYYSSGICITCLGAIPTCFHCGEVLADSGEELTDNDSCAGGKCESCSSDCDG
jgi:hypothetical protein